MSPLSSNRTHLVSRVCLHPRWTAHAMANCRGWSNKLTLIGLSLIAIGLSWLCDRSILNRCPHSEFHHQSSSRHRLPIPHVSPPPHTWSRTRADAAWTELPDLATARHQGRTLALLERQAHRARHADLGSTDRRKPTLSEPSRARRACRKRRPLLFSSMTAWSPPRAMPCPSRVVCLPLAEALKTMTRRSTILHEARDGAGPRPNSPRYIWPWRRPARSSLCPRA